MRDPVHRIKPEESCAIPGAPGDCFRFGSAHGRLHQRPTAEDDENSDGMETESRYFEPDQSEDSQRAGCEPTPVSWRKNAELEVGPEKVKVRDNENRQPLRNIEPTEPFHCIGLTGWKWLGQGIR